jgi:hypothetical protein
VNDDIHQIVEFQGDDKPNGLEGGLRAVTDQKEESLNANTLLKSRNLQGM